MHDWENDTGGEGGTYGPIDVHDFAKVNQCYELRCWFWTSSAFSSVFVTLTMNFLLFLYKLMNSYLSEDPLNKNILKVQLPDSANPVQKLTFLNRCTPLLNL